MKCAEEIGEDLSMPWDPRKAAIYITWAAETKKWASSTLQQYISAIKSAHRREGWPDNWLNYQVKNLIKGFENLSEPRTQRLPITPAIMKILWKNLEASNIKEEDKRLVWAVSTIMYAGSLRGGEILGDKETEYDEDKMLLNKEIGVKTVKVDGKEIRMVLAKIKNPKEMKGKGHVNIEMFEQNTWMCPVRAIMKLREKRKEDPAFPFARRRNGKLLTIKLFNQILKTLLKEVLSYEEGTISSHSFRSGVASAMARAGYNDEDIKRVGRWQSDSFLRYIKLGRSSRLEQQLELMRKLTEIGQNELEEMSTSRN